MKNLIHHTDHLTLYASILLAVGLLLRYIIGKRRFNRRGLAEIQYFKAYGIALITITIEKVVNIIAALMIISAILLYLIK